jgi:ABC-type cobalamin/Fe3+-siderophores transport system ATPase subunit
MELVYLWVEDYKNIHKQGFNFSPRFRCEYDDEKNELTIEENDDYIENFFGDNINVTAIVGKNGSGKSSVLECIDSFNHEIMTQKNYNYKGILVSFIKNTFFYSKEIKVVNLTKYLDKFCGSENDFMLYTFNLLNNNTYNHLEITLTNIVRAFLNNEKLKNIKITNKITNFFGEIVKLKISESNEYRKWIEKKIEDISKVIEITREEVNSSYLSTFTKFILRRKEPLGIKTLAHLVLYSKILEDKNIDILISFLEKVEADIGLTNYINENDYNTILVEFYKKTLNYKWQPSHSRFELNEYILLINKKNIDYTSMSNKDKSIILKYINLLNIDFYNLEDISFNELSSGEKKLFGQLSIFHLNMTTGNNEHYIRLLDEPDNELHPAWQKKYIDEVIQSLSIYKAKKFHFIITSHSPFLLSDIPKQNIIFLDKDEKGNCKVVDGLKEKKQTFGANIHTLLSDSFFMEDGLMGEFAKGKIDEVIRLLNQDKLDEKELKYCEQIISIVGEPIVKNQLQRMLDSKRLKKVDEIDAIKKSMEAMQKRLDELEK